MVKIGVVEFLVKFDTVGKQFKDVIVDALKDADIGTEEIQERLIGIEGHLGLLVTPYSGNRMVDLVKSKGYLAQLKRPEWIKPKEEAIASSEMLLRKFGLGHLAPGSEEAKEAVKEQFEAFRKDLAEYIKITMSSEYMYTHNLPVLQDVVGFMTAALEGKWPSLMEKIFDKIKPERAVDQAVFVWLEDEMKANVGRTQRLWDQLRKDAGLDPENVIETYQQFLDYLGQKFKDDKDKMEILKEIFFGDPAKVSPELQKEINEMITEVTFKAGLQIPRILRKGLEDALEIERDELKEKGGTIKTDLKIIVDEVTKTKEIIEKMGKALTDEDKANLIKRALDSIEKYGWYFMPGESKTTGTLREYEQDIKRMKAGMGREVLTAAYMGEIFATFTQQVATKTSVEATYQQVTEELPKKIIESVEGNLKVLNDIYKYVLTIPQKGEQYDDIMRSLTRIFNG